MKKFEISIPTPCHENWNQMSPQERGRFCKMCSKTVLDYSTMSSTEIQQFIEEHQHEKLCGRFRNDQLKQPVRLEFSYKSYVNRLSFSQSFLLSMLIVFGATLFSCKTHDDETISEISITEKILQIPVQNEAAQQIVSGEFEVAKSIIHPINLSRKVKSIPTDKLLPDTFDLPAVDINSKSVVTVCYTVGGLFIHQVEVEGEILDIFQNEASIDTVESTSDIESASPKFVVYPNPAQDFVNVKFDPSKETLMEITLYDLNGKLIRILLSEVVPEGQQNLQIDLNGLSPATYLLRIFDGSKATMERIVVM